MKIIYMNCRLINEYESDLHSCKQYCAAVKVRPVVDFNPWSLWYQYSILLTELTNQLGAGHFVGGNKPGKWWINDCCSFS